MILWTIQHKAAYEEMLRTGVLRANEEKNRQSSRWCRVTGMGMASMRRYAGTFGYETSWSVCGDKRCRLCC